MLLPMFGLILVLIVSGGLASLVAVADPHHARLAPFIGFITLFSGIGALFLSLGLTLLIGVIFPSETLAGIGLFGGYIVGGLGGAAFGLKRAFERRYKIESQADND